MFISQGKHIYESVRRSPKTEADSTGTEHTRIVIALENPENEVGKDSNGNHLVGKNSQQRNSQIDELYQFQTVNRHGYEDT